MKKLILPLFTLVFPLLSNAGIVQVLAQIEETRLRTGLCEMSEEELNNTIGQFDKVKKRSKKGEFVAATAVRDLVKSRNECTPDALDSELLNKSVVESFEPSFPMSIFEPFTTAEAEREQNEHALQFIKSKENGVCEKIKLADAYNTSLWHKVIIRNGWSCVADNYINVSQEMNASMGYQKAQCDANILKETKLDVLKSIFKDVFKKELKNKSLKVALVPHLSWENGALNTVFPYSLFLKKTELTTYKFLVNELKKLGVSSVFIERNSLNPLEKQVEETKQGIAALNGKHIIISRSMGARVMREIIAENDTMINNKINAYFNIGGTPHGSVIARAKIHPDSFYRGTAISVTDVFKLPLGVITKDPRLPDHLEETLYSALDRNNLATMVPIDARRIQESNVPVLNAVFVRRDHERAAPQVDPVWKHMLEQGPTEGSSPLVGASVDTSNSMRVIMDSDHLAFWKYTPKEGLEVYLRLLILAKHSGLIK